MLTHLSLKKTAALALALGAVSAGPASAMPVGPLAIVHVTSAPSAPQATAVPNGTGHSPQLGHRNDEYLSQVTPTARGGFTTHPRIVTSGAPADRGFNWGDAGIGAAGGLALSLLALGGAVAARSTGRRIEPVATR
jgi:hypothetical protein